MPRGTTSLAAGTCRPLYTRCTQGTKDPFATGDLLDRVVARLDGATLEWLEGAGHSFEVAGVKRSQDEIGASLAPRVAAFVRAH